MNCMENKNGQLAFPKDLFNTYLKKVSIYQEKDLNKDSIESIFRVLAEDFRNGVLSLDDFSSISGHLSTYFSNENDREWLSDAYSGIKNMLEIASDLSYQVRHPSNTLLEYLQEVTTYPDYIRIK